LRIRRSQLARLIDPAAFCWGAGIEDTFVTAPSPKTGRMLDEYELTQHYERWRSDIDLLGELRIPVARYGIPWHRINPARGVWDFSWADGPLERLLAKGIEPIVDLVHYGIPAWMPDAYLESDFPALMSEYAVRVADRYKGRVYAYTPLNEPRVTAWYCGKLGWWPPFRRGWRGFVSVMLSVCRGIVTTAHALHAVDSEIVCVHVDATDLYSALSFELEAEASRRQDIVFLALDLITGRIGPEHPLYAWLLAHGASPADLSWFEQRALPLDVVGINLYPMFSQKNLVRTRSGLRMRMPYASGDIVERLATLYWQRYRRPLLISETASVGSVRKRMAWLEASVAAAARVRESGIPLVGYVWWPLFALVTWGYREGTKPAGSYLRQMGLWDLRPGPAGLERVRTALVDRYQAYVAGASDAVGLLHATNDSGSRPHAS
jgi:beta-glucosidase